MGTAAHGLGHKAHEAMTAKREAAQTRALSFASEANLMHGAVECDTNWKYSSKSSPLQCQNNVTIIIVEDSCSMSMRRQEEQ